MLNKNTMNHYDFAECRGLAQACPRNDTNYTEALEYFHKRVFLCDGEMLYYYHQGALTRMKTDKFFTSKTMGFPKEFIKKIKETIVEYDEVLEIEDYEVDFKKRKINTLSRVYATELGDVKVTQKGKDYVEFFKTYLREIIANNIEERYQYLLKYCACVVQLKKMDIVLNLVTRSEGTGKTSLSKVLGSVIGQNLYTATKVSQFGDNNMTIYGKALVLLEETEGVNISEYGKLMDTLKNMSTGMYWVYRELYANPKTLKNISNIQTTSNFDLNMDGRRAVNMRISTKWLANNGNWEKLNELDEENIKALYDFLLSIDVSKFNAQSEARTLKQNDDNAKLRSIENMNSVWAFIRENYALVKQTEITKIRQSELLDEYNNAAVVGKRIQKKSQFCDLVEELNIVKRTADQNLTFYFIDHAKLFEEFKKRNLILSEEEYQYNGGKEVIDTVIEVIETKVTKAPDAKKEEEEENKVSTCDVIEKSQAKGGVKILTLKARRENKK